MTLAQTVKDLIHPQTGVGRGLLNSDPGDKVIGIRIDELRKIQSTLKAVDKIFSEIGR